MICLIVRYTNKMHVLKYTYFFELWDGSRRVFPVDCLVRSRHLQRIYKSRCRGMAGKQLLCGDQTARLRSSYLIPELALRQPKAQPALKFSSIYRGKDAFHSWLSISRLVDGRLIRTIKLGGRV